MAAAKEDITDFQKQPINPVKVFKEQLAAKPAGYGDKSFSEHKSDLEKELISRLQTFKEELELVLKYEKETVDDFSNVLSSAIPEDPPFFQLLRVEILRLLNRVLEKLVLEIKRVKILTDNLEKNFKYRYLIKNLLKINRQWNAEFELTHKVALKIPEAIQICPVPELENWRPFLKFTFRQVYQKIQTSIRFNLNLVPDIYRDAIAIDEDMRDTMANHRQYNSQLINSLFRQLCVGQNGDSDFDFLKETEEGCIDCRLDCRSVYKGGYVVVLEK